MTIENIYFEMIKRALKKSHSTLKSFITYRLASEVLFSKPFNEKSPNVNHDRKIIFLRIPKTGGTSIKHMMKMSPDKIIHDTPSNIAHKETWEKYKSFTVVRHPFDRFLSSYFYHTSEKYNNVEDGHYTKIYPDLEKFGIKEYFAKFTSNTNALRPQSDYIVHKFSQKVVDRVCKYEKFKRDVSKILGDIGVHVSEIPHIKKSKRNFEKMAIGDDFIEEVVSYYRQDFDIFNYTDCVDSIRSKYVN